MDRAAAPSTATSSLTTGAPTGGRGDRPGHSSPVLRQVALPGRRTLWLRHMRRGDVDGLVALFDRLSEDDLYRRFFSARPPPEPFVAEMTEIDHQGGVGLVAVVAGVGDEEAGQVIVAEATCSPLPDGDGELGITVAPEARGWLGPYLLDVLLEVAAEKGFANLQADVLATNSRMLAMLRRRGCAVLGFEERPAVVRLAVGAATRFPTWPAAGPRRRVLVEVPGGRWTPQSALRAAGYGVMACAGPPGGWEACPVLRGEPCPLAAGADVVVCAVPGDVGRAILAGHRHVHPRPVRWVEVGPATPSELRQADATPLLRSTPPEEIVVLAREVVPPR